VDGFNQDQSACKGDERRVILGSFLASHSDALEALQLANGLFDAGAGVIEYLGEENRPALGVQTIRNDRAYASLARCLAVGHRIVSLIADSCARRDIRADIEQRFEIAAVAGLTSCQMESDRTPIFIGLQMDFR
jgi:hypothetical protein